MAYSSTEEGRDARAVLNEVLAAVRPGDAVFIVVVPEDAACREKRFWTQSSRFHTWQLCYAATALQAHASQQFKQDKDLL